MICNARNPLDNYVFNKRFVLCSFFLCAFVFTTSHPLFSVKPNSQSQMPFPIYNFFFVTWRDANYFLIPSLYCLLLLLLFKSIECRIFLWYPAMTMKLCLNLFFYSENWKRRIFLNFLLKFMVKIIIRSCYTIKTLKEYKFFCSCFTFPPFFFCFSFFFFYKLRSPFIMVINFTFYLHKKKSVFFPSLKEHFFMYVIYWIDKQNLT